MKLFPRRTAAVVLTVLLSFPAASSFAAGRDTRDRDRSRDRDPIVRIIKKIQKVFGITSNDDIPSPPKP